MAQQKMYVGTVLFSLPDAGDDKHSLYFKDGKPIVIESVGKADSSSVAEKLGQVTVGGPKSPLYLLDGVPTAIESVAKADVSDKVGTGTVGSPTKPVYIRDGVPTPIDNAIALGTENDIVLGDGTVKSIGTFLDEHIEEIREKLGVVTVERDGLVPKLPEDPEA